MGMGMGGGGRRWSRSERVNEQEIDIEGNSAWRGCNNEA
jgi:hypothetical protein